ncbi:hypothetical protein DP113_19025 [Brasilonema octagenarum UFV-E1]|uniref:Uncharacterized protein n=2 Tax=Brasilonema TaxID=383614 RepID=A0A856MEU8_9CYAN|nr:MULTISPECIES: hypothetical protein [Brasilonema]NMF63742.1 hypothetical protein [Brasilonema octagenarum UFV-OR1]QDL09723.1 hypothetical protein DP114_19095 [Brasilonema sennae CENA114]QDL16077.1 hypothetical protein DP113_19025 [Brasilonema octagenarum UFV-E1]
MIDQSLLKDLEQFQELSEQEAKEVSGGKSSVIDVKYTNVGACPACRSGFDPKVTNQYDGIIKK